MNESPFDIIDSRWGSLERWRVLALQTGEVGALTELSRQLRNDSIDALENLEERERAVTEREAQCDACERALEAAVTRFHAETERADALAERLAAIQRADQERAPLPPGAAAADDTPAPDGTLHALSPKEGSDLGKDASGEFLRLHNDETEFPAGELPPPPQQQPIAAGLDGEDED